MEVSKEAAQWWMSNEWVDWIAPLQFEAKIWSRENDVSWLVCSVRALIEKIEMRIEQPVWLPVSGAMNLDTNVLYVEYEWYENVRFLWSFVEYWERERSSGIMKKTETCWASIDE